MRLHENPWKSLSCNCWRKKDLKKITISELVQRAGVSRAPLSQLCFQGRDFEVYFQSSIQRLPSPWMATTQDGSLQVWVYLFKEVKKKPRSLA